MKSIAVTNLPNQAFSSEKLYLDEDYIIACPDTPLLPAMKRSLIEWGFKEIFSEEEADFTEFSSLAEAEGILLRKSNGESLQETEAGGFFEELCDFTAKMFESYKEGRDPKLAVISEQVKKLIAMTKTHKEFLLNLAEYESNNIDYNVSQSVKTAVLTIAMSDTLRFPAHKQMDLGTASLLHRVGILQIPSDLFYSDRMLTPEEKKQVTLFPVLGFRILKGFEYPLPICLAILEHRENIDGTGYPRGITGDKISLYGKILSVASSYCAAVSKRPFRDNLDGHSGILDLIKEKGRKYDEKILRVLLLTLTVYPIGTYVRMNDGSIGIVHQTNSLEPKLPVLKMIFDEEMTPYADPPILHTSETDDIQIERALNRVEVEDVRAQLPKNT